MRILCEQNRLANDGSGRSTIDVYVLLRTVKKLEHCHLIVLKSCSYEGVMVSVDRLITEILSILDDITFVFDEAWLAFRYFQSLYRPLTAMVASQ
ncbi:MAG TPA: hypothetical protein DIT97_09750 [Gimesia maris]|uniref:Uncharacterized protein n=1 Tax=Gimesia maris TaxID=122 RepID=A0A3D3R362_9PLAN|nr:hypothetical protein [Gimesia maris]|tara:strand:- start:1477 stop:1761 length:285 start_codon:yes stop_codon:yes gene_type:complete